MSGTLRVLGGSPQAVLNLCTRPVASGDDSSAGEKASGSSFVQSSGPGGIAGGRDGEGPPPSLRDRLEAMLQTREIPFWTRPHFYHEELVGPATTLQYAYNLEMMSIAMPRDDLHLLFAPNPLSACFERMLAIGSYIVQKRNFVLGLLRRFSIGTPLFREDSEFRPLEDFLFEIIGVPEKIDIELMFDRDGRPVFFDVGHAYTFMRFFCRERPIVDALHQYKVIKRGKGYIIDSYCTRADGQDGRVNRIIQFVPGEEKIAIVQLGEREYFWLTTCRVEDGLLRDYRPLDMSGYSRERILNFTPPVFGFVDEDGNIPEFPSESIRRREGLRREANRTYAAEDPDGELRRFYAGVQVYKLLALQLARKLLDALKA
jgi:hypothetical protein